MATKQTVHNILTYLLTQHIISHCYILPTSDDFSNHNQLNWLQAESHCLSTYNSHLISIHDSETLQKIQNEISNMNQNHHHFWIGLSSNSSYLWSDSSPFDFGLHLLPNTSTDYQHITLQYNRNKQQLQWTNTNSNDTNFWICNDSPSHLQSTQTATTLSAQNMDKEPLLYKYMILIIIASLFCICCCITVSFVLILKAATHLLHKLRQQKQCRKVVQNKQSLHSMDTIHSVLSDNERSCVDEGIIDKFMCKKKSQSINLTVDMSTGHIVMNIEDIDDIEEEEDGHKVIQKPYEKAMESVANGDEDVKSLNEVKEEKEDEDITPIELAPDEFIVSECSMEKRKITDGFCDDQNQSNDGSVLEDEDTDGYYIDPEDKPFGGIVPQETNQAMEGHSHFDGNCNEDKKKRLTNESDEEFYEEPECIKKKTDGFVDETREIALRYEFILDKSVNDGS